MVECVAGPVNLVLRSDPCVGERGGLTAWLGSGLGASTPMGKMNPPDRQNQDTEKKDTKNSDIMQ